MTPQSRFARRLGLALATTCALLLSAALGHADEGDVTEEFHHSYPLTASGRVSLENINGPVHISAWDRNEVKVDAVKRAWSKSRLDEAKLVIHSDNDHLTIRTEYPDRDNTFWSGHHQDNPASVEYTLTVPRTANLDQIELINGSLDLTGVAGEVRASCINGHLSAHGLQGRAKLSTVNSRVEANFDKLSGSPIELESVNGSVLVTLPSDSSADVEASTVSGHISNDFGLQVNDHRFVGHDLRGQLGSGTTRIRLENVNGRIEIRHANDGRPLSPVKSFSRAGKDDDDDDDDDSEI
jgi:DUF4097 and DUF4098 domain-containing protein YvlB